MNYSMHAVNMVHARQCEQGTFCIKSQQIAEYSGDNVNTHDVQEGVQAIGSFLKCNHLNQSICFGMQVFPVCLGLTVVAALHAHAVSW